jgi:hypothetical protein
MKIIKTIAKFLGINKKTILLAALMPIGMMLLGFALTFVCTEFMADANAVGKLFPMFVAGSIFVSIASVSPYIVRYVAPADVKAECSDVFTKRVHVAFGKAITLFIMGLISMISTIVAAEVFALACPYMTEIKMFSTLDFVLGECVAGTMLLAVGLSFLVSTLAKTSKKAEIFTPVAGFVMVIISAVPFIPAVSAWVSASGIAPYCIPVFNTSVVLNNMVNASAVWNNVNICGAVNGVIVIILAVCAIIKYTKDTSIEY